MKNERWMAVLLMVMVVACSLSFLILGRNVVRLVNVRQQSIEYGTCCLITFSLPPPLLSRMNSSWGWW
jgi:hypothetical protein